jgi:hypothetical protein
MPTLKQAVEDEMGFQKLFGLVSLWLLLLLMGCGTPSATPTAVPTTPLPPNATSPPADVTDESGELILTAEFEGIIFSRERAEQMGLAPFFGSTLEGYWTPGEADIMALEGGLESYLQQAASRDHPDLWQKLPEYKRQYFGLVESGRREIYANLFCDTLGKDWKRDFVSVLDGGACFFSVKYDVNTNAFFDLYVQGES